MAASKQKRKPFHPVPGVRWYRGEKLVIGRPGLLSFDLKSDKQPAAKAKRAAGRDSTPVVQSEQVDPYPKHVRTKRPDKLFLKGHQAWTAGDPAAAAALWRETVELDPNYADAWLGLHALDPSDPSLLTVLAEQADRIGDAQKRLNVRVWSYYLPIGFVEERIECADDARWARARELSDQGEYERAQMLVGLCTPCTLTTAMQMKICFDSGDHQRCVQYAQQIPSEDWVLAPDVGLLSGIALRTLGLTKASIGALEAALAAAPTREAALCIRYHLALSYENDDEARARAEYETIYAQDINYADVADRLGVNAEEADEPAPEGWDLLVSSFESGEVADDPKLADNG